MRSVPLDGHRVPIITRGQAHGDILFKAPDEDKNVSSAERNFVEKNMSLQGSLGSSPEEQIEEADVRKSTLVEIPTPTSRLLYKINGIFPFDFVPDSLVIDEIKVSFVYRSLFSRLVNSVLIKDITDILVSNNPFFGSVTVSGGDYEGTAGVEGEKGPLVMRFLRIDEAMRARRIIMGLMIFSDQKVDTSQMKVEEVVKKTEELGRARTG